MKTKLFFYAILIFTIASCTSNSPVIGNEVIMSGMSFSPATLTVSVGTTVTWVNNETTIHTVTSTTGLFDSGDMSKGKTFKYTFTQAGTYPYHCIHHSGMNGTIVVLAGTTMTINGTGY